MSQAKASTRKSPNICSSCRFRKVRCDGRRSRCGNCDRLGLVCSFDNSDVSERFVQRHRARRACVQCHSRKSRCSGDTPACQRCDKHGLQCIYPPAKQPTPTSFASPSSQAGFNHEDLAPEIASDDISNVIGRQPVRDNPYLGKTGSQQERIDQLTDPPEGMIQQALERFFQYIYPIPVFSFLHKATIMDRHCAGSLDKCLAFSIAGICSVMLNVDEKAKECGAKYINTAEDMIIRSRESPTVYTIQALVLIIKYRAARRQFAAVFMLTAIAVRSAMALRMNYEDYSLSFLVQEECRRTMWSLYMIDTTLAAGYQDFALCPEDIIHIQLPCHERNYELDLPQNADGLSNQGIVNGTTDSSSLALAVRVTNLRYRILKFTKRVVGLQSLEFRTGILELQSELDMFSIQLPSALQFSEKNTRLHSYSSSFAAFTTMHIIWHGAHCILYRLALEGFKEALPKVILAQTDPAVLLHYQQQCLQHAIALAELYRVILLYKSHKPLLDVDIAVSAYQSARIMLHLHDKVPGTIPSPAELLSKVGYCQEFLIEIFPQCEAIDAIRRDLKDLVERGISRPTTPTQIQTSNTSCGPTALEGLNTSHHILSRHSLVGQMDLPHKRGSPDPSGRLTPGDEDDAIGFNHSSVVNVEYQLPASHEMSRNHNSFIPETQPGQGRARASDELLDGDLPGAVYPAFPELLHFDMDSSIWLDSTLADTNGFAVG